MSRLTSNFMLIKVGVSELCVCVCVWEGGGGARRVIVTDGLRPPPPPPRTPHFWPPHQSEAVDQTTDSRQVHARQKLPSFPVKVFSVDSAT